MTMAGSCEELEFTESDLEAALDDLQVRADTTDGDTYSAGLKDGAIHVFRHIQQNAQ